MDTSFEKESESSNMFNFNPITFVLTFLARYGWHVVGVVAVCMWAALKLRPHLRHWRQAREDALHHKDPDAALARAEALARAREEQQRRAREASERARELQVQREEKKRQENLERLQKYGASGSGGHKLGTPPNDRDFLPLSGGASTSSYRPPKRSACGGGGCGR